MELKFDVYAKIARPLAEVFEAVRDPKILSSYFTTGGASGPLREGDTVRWRFSGFDDDYPVKVTKLVPNERIEFGWETNSGGYDTRVVISFEALNPASTLVRIAESGWKEDPTGLSDSYGNCHGWTQMLCSLKAWVEHGINLRKGFY